MFWVYVLLSLKDYKKYVGFSTNINLRLKQHKEGKVTSTSYRRPLRLIYLEACLCEEDAKRREKYLKTTGGRRFLAKRLKSYYVKYIKK
jgi:putative endonuclease